MRKLWLIPLGLLALVVALAAGLWLARARLAGEIAQNYFRQHGIASSIGFSRLTLSGVAGSIALGPAAAPDFSAQAVEVDFDPLQYIPRIVAVRLINPVIRARLDENGKVSFPSLQAWLDSLSASGAHSDYVSDDLAVSLSNLRALLTTPAGALELNGEAKIQHSQLIAAALTARPGALSWHGWQIHLAHAGLKLAAAPSGYGGTAHFDGAVKNQMLAAGDFSADLSAPRIAWDTNAKTFTIPSLSLKAMAASMTAGGVTAAHPVIDLSLQAARGTLAGDAAADITLSAGADFSPGAMNIPGLSRDKKLIAAMRDNLKHLDFALNAKLARQKGQISFALSRPMDIKGARGATLHLAAFSLSGPLALLDGVAAASLSGPGLPALSFSSRAFRFQDGAFSGDAALKAHFDFDMLHGAEIEAGGTAAFRDGVFTFRLGGCAPATLAGFHPAASDLAQTIHGSVCAAPGQETFSASASGWKFSATAQNVAMMVPLGTVSLAGGAGTIAFSGKGADMAGKISVSAAEITDRAAPHRFEAMTGTGDILLDNWVWHGQFAVSGKSKDALGTVSFRHAIATGEGEMTIAAPGLKFAQGKLQPSMLSPLLGTLTHVEGAARFDGKLAWTHDAITSSGLLNVDQLDFLTPLGTAHAVKTSIALSSLLPPVTAPGQHIAISKVDWALPLSGIAIDFSYGGGALKLDSFSSGISGGNLHLGTLTIDLTGPHSLAGAADLDGIALAPLVAASNLGNKIRLEGNVTGKLPFTFGPEGFRIQNGHVAAAGPGHIWLDRSVWEQGGATASNAVQDLAYQAMENLAFDQLSADINSIPGGRLQVVFHVKGHSDPPHPQQAEVAIADIINGTALQKTVALPSGTPIDLTLDTTLNFDQLLQSYAEAWSKALGPTGQSN